MVVATRHLLLLALLLVPVALATAAWPPLINTTSGVLQGIREELNTGTVAKYLGVRYAKPPVGDLRFKAPKPLDDYGGRVNATRFRASCMQPHHTAKYMYPQLRGDNGYVEVSEDCLFLNIFMPLDLDNIMPPQPLPVMIWLPGEGYNYASSSQFNVSSLVSTQNIIVVTVNYRVGAFGFLSSGSEEAPGNMGLLDQLEAIRWVKANAVSFGGNPDSITLFGRLTGSISISALLASPRSIQDDDKLFHRAILQSGVAVDKWVFDSNPNEGLEKLARKTGCWLKSTHETLECLRNLSAEHLLNASVYLHSWRLVLDKHTLPEEPLDVIRQGKHLPVPVILGTTDSEGSLCYIIQSMINSDKIEKIRQDQLQKNHFKDLVSDLLTMYNGESPNESLVNSTIEHYSANKSLSWRDRYLNFCGDQLFVNNTLAYADALSRQGSGVFLYQFSQRPRLSFYPHFINAASGDDVLFSLGLLQQTRIYTRQEVDLSKSMMGAWANFAKTGNPNPIPEYNEEWPAYSINESSYWEFFIRGKKVVNDISTYSRNTF